MRVLLLVALLLRSLVRAPTTHRDDNVNSKYTVEAVEVVPPHLEQAT